MAVLGVDIGGTSVKTAPVDVERGVVIDEPSSVDTPDPAPPGPLAEAVAAAIGPLLDRTEGDIGCTFPGRIRQGVSLSAVNLSELWVGERPGDHFEDLVGRRFHLLNDADAAGIAEMRFGAGRDRLGVVLIVTLGTGIGTALFNDGLLVPNTELGEVHVDGRPACELVSKAAREDRGASWEEWAVDVGRFLQRMQDLVDPDLIIIGGGVSEHPEVLHPALSQPVEVVPAELGNAAGIVGAALFAARGGYQPGFTG